jgi:hypothetical protein
MGNRRQPLAVKGVTGNNQNLTELMASKGGKLDAETVVSVYYLDKI